MKKLVFCLFVMVLATGVSAQTIIATVQSSQATKNHNQRKIVRDYDHHIYVFYQDFVEGSWEIYQVVYDSLNSSWSQPEYLVPGNNPAAAIGFTDSIYLTYRSNDAHGKIMLMKKAPAEDWLPPVQISQADSLDNLLPVADVDMEEKILVSWIERGNPDDKIKFYKNGQINELYASDSISDLSLSTCLLWTMENTIFLALEESGNRVKYFSFENPNEIELLFDTLGTKPCQSIGAYAPGYEQELLPRFIYIDDLHDISMASVTYGAGNNPEIVGPYTLILGPVSEIAIDDLLMPVGFDFLYSDASGFYNAFEGQAFYPAVTIIDWHSPDCFNISIGYKHFSATIVDYIWMESSGSDYDIYYKRSNKIPYDPGVGIMVNKDNGNQLWFSSNPFKENISFRVYTEELTQPVIKIYDLRGSLITSVDHIMDNGNYYAFEWDGKNISGTTVKVGTYILNITIGKHTLNSLIVKE